MEITTTSSLPSQLEPATFKTFQFSQTYQTNERCVEISIDLDIKEPSKFGFQSPRIPHRVIVNNSTLTIFEKPDLSKVDLSFNLDVLEVNSASDQDCISVTDKRTKQSKELCTMLYDTRDHSEVIHKFKDNLIFMQKECSEPIKEITNTATTKAV